MFKCLKCQHSPASDKLNFNISIVFSSSSEDNSKSEYLFMLHLSTEVFCSYYFVFKILLLFIWDFTKTIAL